MSWNIAIVGMMPPTKNLAARASGLDFACRRDLDLFEGLSDGFFYSSISLCLTAAVFSIGASPTSVRNVVRRIGEKTGMEMDRRSWRKADPLPLAKFLPFAKSEGFFGSRQKTSTKAGILKSEAVVQAAESLLNLGIESLEVMQTCDEAKLAVARDAVLKVPGLESGIAWDNFRKLSGDERQVMADRHLVSYVQRETGEPMRSNEVVALVQHVAGDLRREYPHVTPRLLDQLISKFESGRGG